MSNPVKEAAPRPWRRGLVAIAAVLVFVGVYASLRAWPVVQNMRTADERVAAQTLIDGHGLQTSRGKPYAKCPPIYPLLLAALHVAGIEWWASVCIINAASFAAGAFAVYYLGGLLSFERRWPLIAAYLCCGPMWYLVREARPDIIFAVCVPAIVAACVAYWRSGSLASLLALSAICCIAALSRYMALFTSLPLAAATVAFVPGQGLGVRVRRLLVFGLVGCVPIGVWLVRTKTQTGYWSGMNRGHVRSPSDPELTTLDANVRILSRTLMVDAVAPLEFAQLNSVVRDNPFEHRTGTYVVLAAFGGLTFVATFTRAGSIIAEARSAFRRNSTTVIALVAIVVHFVWYQAVTLLLWTLGNNDPINTRFLAPAFFLAVLAASFPVAVYWRACRLPGRTSIAVLVLFFCGAQSAKTVASWNAIDADDASPWVEDLSRFTEAMSTSELEDRVMERMRARGRDTIPERVRDRLRAKGKEIDRSQEKLDRARKLREVMEGHRTSAPAESTSGDVAQPDRRKRNKVGDGE